MYTLRICPRYRVAAPSRILIVVIASVPITVCKAGLVVADGTAAVVIGGSLIATVPANASIRFDLAGDLKSMIVCNDNEPYIYANNAKSWNKAYSTSSFTKTADGAIARGECQLLILDTADEYPNDLPGYRIARGAKAREMVSMGWEILFDKAKPNPSKYNNPRAISSACIGQLEEIPIMKIKSYCFK